MTKITETFMKEISSILSQLFRNDEYLTEKPLSLLLAQRSWLKQAVCPTRELAFFQLEERNILANKGSIHWNVFCLYPDCSTLTVFHSFYLHETPYTSLNSNIQNERNESILIFRKTSQISKLAALVSILRTSLSANRRIPLLESTSIGLS